MPETRRHDSIAAPAAWIVRHAPLVAEGGEILDLACGNGRNGRYFLDRGHPVTFVDVDTSGVSNMTGRQGAEVVAADLETDTGWPLDGRQFAAVLVVNYLWRPILGDILATVAPGGALIYQTFAAGNEAFGRPRNPNFLLRPGELLEAARGRLHVVAYEQRVIETPRPAVVQRIAALRPRS